MAETPDGIVEEMLASNAPSPDVSTPDGAPNGKITCSGTPNMDADGDVNMEQPTRVNGHTKSTDAKLAIHHTSFTPCHSPNRLASPHPVDVEVDDDARPPPAKRARKLSDADQASITNVS